MTPPRQNNVCDPIVCCPGRCNCAYRPWYSADVARIKPGACRSRRRQRSGACRSGSVAPSRAAGTGRPGWRAIDLGSTNGTWVNGVRLNAAPIDARRRSGVRQYPIHRRRRMIETTIDQLIADGWLYAALRIAFIALIYLFLFLVLTDHRARARCCRTGDAWRSGSRGGSRSDRPRCRGVVAGAGAAFSLEPASSLGRVAGNTIVVDDPHISARHAELRFARGQWWLRDLGSSNGTLLNDEPVRAVVGVRPGDVIQCGAGSVSLRPVFSRARR